MITQNHRHWIVAPRAFLLHEIEFVQPNSWFMPGKCLSTIKEEDQFYALDYRQDGSVFAASGKNHTVRMIG